MTASDSGHKPHLLVLTSTYPRWAGDPEPGFVHELAKRLADAFEVTVLGPHAAGAVAEEELEGVRILRFRYAPSRMETLVNDGGMIANLRRAPWKWLLVPVFILGLAWRTWRVVRRERPDAIHAHWLLPQGLVVALLGLLDRAIPPFVVTSHGADLFALRAGPLRALKRLVAHRAAAVTVVSAGMRDELARIGVPPAKIAVRPMGVDMQALFTPDPVVERSSDELLFVGRLVGKKGLRHLIDAMPTILAARPSTFLTVAGFGPEEDERKQQATRLGLQHAVRFVGPVQQSALPALYRRAALFVAPFVRDASGDQEGLGLVVVEAVACGCPVVVSDLPASRDLVEERVRPGDPAALAACILAMLASDPLDREAQSSRLRVSMAQKFAWQPVAAGYVGLFERILAEADAGGRQDARSSSDSS
jgi:glycosyltransferase involved in cell wall biosynthesis